MGDKRLGDDSPHLLIDELTLKNLIDNVVDYAAFLLDINGQVISWNTGCQRVLGYQAEEIKGKNYSVFFTPKDQSANKPSLELRLAAKTGKVEEEVTRVRKNGSSFSAAIITTALYDSQGKLYGFAKIIRDITYRKLSAIEDLVKEATTDAKIMIWQSMLFLVILGAGIIANIAFIVHRLLK